MYSWNDFINDFPHTNFSDINVSWFLNKFKQIFDEWEGLYNQMLSWKTATDEYNATWRTEQEQAFTAWENNFQTAIDAWKTQTETDIGTWETNTIASLEAWKAVFINQYNALKLEVEQIAVDAETAKNSAQASATSAANSADSASATALSLQASLAQIDTNTDDISDLKTQITKIEKETTVNPDSLTIGRFIMRDGTISPEAGNAWCYSSYFELPFAEGFDIDITCSFVTNGGCAIYDKDKNCLLGIDGNNVQSYGGIYSTSPQTITIPYISGMKYIRASLYNIANPQTTDISVKGVTLAGAFERINALENADAAINADIGNAERNISTLYRIAEQNSKLKPYIVEIKSRYLWAHAQEPSAFISGDAKYTEDGNANNAFFKISGNAGDNFVTVISGGNADIADFADYTNPWSAVISYDGVHFEQCLATYRDAETISIYPALADDITEGELGNMWVDGMHLSRRGYIGFAQAVFTANAKHCEKKSYIAKYVPNVDSNPFTAIGGTMYAAVQSDYMYTATGGYLMSNRAHQYKKLNTGGSETTGKRGIKYEVNTEYAVDGYAEIMIGGPYRNNPQIPDGYEIHVDMYINGELSEQYTKNSNRLETIYFDYVSADKITLEIYTNKQAASQGNGAGFTISSIYLWENITKETELFPRGAIVGEMFDSWGVFHSGASGKEFARLVNEKAGVTVPFENHSLGSQTSAWGKAWFYENLQKYHPAIGIVDFGINDFHSMDYPAIPATVEGPDGTVYDNKLTIDEYAENMQVIADEARNNNIQIIMTSCPLDTAGAWYYALADNIG